MGTHFKMRQLFQTMQMIQAGSYKPTTSRLQILNSMRLSRRSIFEVCLNIVSMAEQNNMIFTFSHEKIYCVGRF